MIRLVATAIFTLALAGCFTQPPAPTVDRAATSPSRTSATPVAAPAPAGPGFYTVKKGDTLYRIALDNGQDYRDLATWNNLANPSSIKEGQVLRVQPEGAESGGSKPVAVAAGVETRPLAPAATPAPAAGNLKKEPKGGKEPYSDEAYVRANNTAEATRPAPESKPEPTRSETKPESAPVAASGEDVAWAWPTSAKVTTAYNDSSNKGLDFAGRSGDNVLAAGDGKVVYAGSGLRGYGELIIVKHNGTFLSAYAHNRKILVKEGQMVTRGQKIAEMGNTDADSVKLHFEIRKQGKPVDPAIYLPKR